VANIIQNNIRKADWAFRYGGKEFVILLPGTSKLKAITSAERLREKVSEYQFSGEEQQPLGRLTISVGIASSPPDTIDSLDLIQKADEALYKAKSDGRNRVYAYHQKI
jgi:diguanylate cyclase (GGDEF)-like protein